MTPFFCKSLTVARRPLRWLAIALLACCANVHAAEPASVGSNAGANAYSQLPLRRDADAPDIGWRMLAGLGVLAVAGAFLVFRARKAGQRGGRPIAGWTGRAPATIDVLEKRNLGAAASLFVVRWNGEELLLAGNANGVSVISRRPAAAHAGVGPA